RHGRRLGRRRHRRPHGQVRVVRSVGHGPVSGEVCKQRGRAGHRRHRAHEPAGRLLARPPGREVRDPELLRAQAEGDRLRPLRRIPRGGLEAERLPVGPVGRGRAARTHRGQRSAEGDGDLPVLQARVRGDRRGGGEAPPRSCGHCPGRARTDQPDVGGEPHPDPPYTRSHGGAADERDLPAGRGQAVRPGDGRERARPGGPGRDLLRPARAERRGQVDHDADADRPGPRRRGRDPRDGARAARRLEAGAHRDGRRPPARQPGRRAPHAPDAGRVRPDLPGAGRGAARGRRPRPPDREPDQPRRHARLRALRRDAAPAPDRPRPDPRAHGRARPAGAAGAVGTDRPPARVRRDGADVDALHRGGRAARRYGGRHVTRAHRRAGPARGGRARRGRRAGARGVRHARAPRVGLAPGRRGRLAHASQRPGGGDRAGGAAGRRRARRRAPPRQPRGRVRHADRGADRVTAPVHRVRRLEPAALAGVMSRDIVLFGRYWKATTFSSVVQPTIYLLAFGLGFGSLVSHVEHVRYVEYVGTGVVATAVLFSSAFPGMFNTFIRWKFQRTYDAMLAAPVDVEELITAEVLWISVRAGVYGVAPLIVAMAFGLSPNAGMLLVPFAGFVT